MIDVIFPEATTKGGSLSAEVILRSLLDYLDSHPEGLDTLYAQADNAPSNKVYPMLNLILYQKHYLKVQQCWVVIAVLAAVVLLGIVRKVKVIQSPHCTELDCNYNFVSNSIPL